MNLIWEISWNFFWWGGLWGKWGVCGGNEGEGLRRGLWGKWGGGVCLGLSWMGETATRRGQVQRLYHGRHPTLFLMRFPFNVCSFTPEIIPISTNVGGWVCHVFLGVLEKDPTSVAGNRRMLLWSTFPIPPPSHKHLFVEKTKDRRWPYQKRVHTLSFPPESPNRHNNNAVGDD